MLRAPPRHQPVDKVYVCHSGYLDHATVGQDYTCFAGVTRAVLSQKQQMLTKRKKKHVLLPDGQSIRLASLSLHINNATSTDNWRSSKLPAPARDQAEQNKIKRQIGYLCSH